MVRIPFIARKRSISFVTWPWGMANRILPMGCILSLAAELNYRSVMFWTPDDVVARARFGDLFDTTDLPFKLVEGYKARAIQFTHLRKDKPLSLRKKILGLLILKLLAYDKKILLTGREEHRQFCELQNLNLNRYRKIILYAHIPFRYEYEIGWLKPAPAIAPRIIELKKQFSPNTLGVHLRGTDTNNEPPVEKMITRMRAEIDMDPDVRFFFASDGDKAGRRIIDTFGDRLIMNTDNAPRGTVEGQQDAAVDLFALADTSRIIGPRYSTFSALAAMIGNRPALRIINRPLPPNSPATQE